MTYTEFRKIVAGYLNRDQSAFVMNGSDLLGRAIHRARRHAERLHNFELARVSVSVPVTVGASGTLLSGAVNVNDPTEKVAIKTIERAFLPFLNNSGDFPIEVISRNRHMERVRARFADSIDRQPVQHGTPSASTFAVVRQNDYIYITPPDTTILGSSITVKMDVVRWMPDYGKDLVGTTTGNTANKLTDSAAQFITNGVKIGDLVFNTTDGTSATVTAIDSETALTLNANTLATVGKAYKVSTGNKTDFFLEYCEGFMLFRSIVELNFFLKEDQRVAISASALEDAWESVIRWDASMVDGSSLDVTLD